MGQIKERDLPNMLLVSGNILLFLVAKPRTPMELLTFVSGLTLETNPDLDTTNVSLVVDWCAGAAQPDPTGKQSQLALVMTPVLTADKQFLRWKHERLVGTLGQAAATATPQQQTDPFMQNMFAGFQ